MIPDERIAAMLAKLLGDKSGLLEMEVRFGRLSAGTKPVFHTGVTKKWFEAVNEYLIDHTWDLSSVTTYKQYKNGHRRIRVYDNGIVEGIRKRSLSRTTFSIAKGKDIRVSLSQEKHDEGFPMQGKSYDLVNKMTYRREVFSFDLTKTKKRSGKRSIFEYRVELEIDASKETVLPATEVLNTLKAIIGEVALI
jgi:hypothetical protein